MVTDGLGSTQYVCDGPIGPTGAAGPTGPTGPQGPAGIAARERISQATVPQTLIPGAKLTGSATCSTGKVVLGGGGYADNPNFVMVSSTFQGDSSWWVTFQNVSTTNQTVTVTSIAICAIVN